jgi:arylsulfatase
MALKEYKPGTTFPGVIGRTAEVSQPAWPEPNRAKEGAPNVLFIVLDDTGFGHLGCYGSPIETPNIDALAAAGLRYTNMHTTALCSPSRSCIITGRNHHSNHLACLTNGSTGYPGSDGYIPFENGFLSEILLQKGYNTYCLGKWHLAPEETMTAAGPYERWPLGRGFERYYGFLGGDTHQYYPELVRDNSQTEPETTPEEGYHLTPDLVEKAKAMIADAKQVAPNKPFFMYFAPGAMHSPHHVPKEWADKYKRKFDGGWDAMRERIFKRQKELGWIPADAKLTPRADTMPAWDSIPESERPFQRRLMEVFAGFVEHVDAQVGRVIDGLDELGIRDNTIVFYIWGDNGSSAEGQNGSISELLAQNQIPNTIQQQIEALNKIGGLDALGGPKVDNMYHAGWAWAGDTPFHHTKLIASHFGGTRNPMAVSWPKRIKPDKTPRPQFHHVNDIAPTLYEILGIKPPKVVDGFKQDPVDGASMVYTFGSAKAPGRKRTQYFDNNGSRGIYHDGWYACAFGPLTPWLTVSPGLTTWDANKDVWELYNLETDFSQADDLAGKYPKRLERMKALFLKEAEKNKVFPIGAGIWLRLYPEDRIKTPYTRWRFDASTTRMPEFTAPGLGRESNRVIIEAEFGENASGVLYALGGASGGLTLFMDQGRLTYEYNMMIIERYTAQTDRIAGGKHVIEVGTTLTEKRPLSPAEIVIRVDGKEAARTTVKRTVPAAFTASETFDVGVDLGSPVSLVYAERRPFPFSGKIRQVQVELK